MTNTNQSKGHGYRWLIFTLLAGGYVLVYFHRLCPAVLVVDLMRDLHAGGGLVGLLAAAYFYPYALMQLPAGLLADSWGPRNTIAFFFVIAGVGSVMLGLAPTVGWAIAGRTIVGLGVAMLFVATLKILAEWFRAEEFGRMTGLLLGVGGVGSLSAALPLVWLSAAVGWRNAFLLVGGFTLLLAVLVRLWVYDRPALKGRPASLTAAAEAAVKIPLLHGVRMVVTCRHFWPLAIWFFFDFAVFFSFAGLWGGPYLTQIHGLSPAAAGGVLNMLAVGLVIGGPLTTTLADRLWRRRKPVLLLCGGVVLLLIVMFYYASPATPLWVLYVGFLLFSACGNGVGAVVFTMNKELFPVEIAGTATGLINLFPFAGAALFQPLIGCILEAYGKTGASFSAAGYRAVFIVYLGAVLVALAAALAARESRVGGAPAVA